MNTINKIIFGVLATVENRDTAKKYALYSSLQKSIPMAFCTVEQRHGCTWILFPEEITMDNCQIIEQEIGQAIETTGSRIAIDLLSNDKMEAMLEQSNSKKDL